VSAQSEHRPGNFGRACDKKRRSDMISIESTVTILTGIAETGAISFVILMIFRGLRSQVKGLKRTVDVQSQTIQAMETRVLETEKISELYRSFIEDYPNTLEQYKSTIVNTKNEIISDLTKRVQDQNATIDGLQRQVERLNPEEIRSFERIAGLLLTEPLSEFQEFLQKIDGRKELAIYSILRTKTLEGFLRANGYSVVVEGDLVARVLEWWRSDTSKIEFASFGGDGLSYAFTRERSVLVSESGQKVLERQLEDLRNPKNLAIISS
jgi:hypothetical protein